MTNNKLQDLEIGDTLALYGPRATFHGTFSVQKVQPFKVTLKGKKSPYFLTEKEDGIYLKKNDELHYIISLD